MGVVSVGPEVREWSVVGRVFPVAVAVITWDGGRSRHSGAE